MEELQETVAILHDDNDVKDSESKEVLVDWSKILYLPVLLPYLDLHTLVCIFPLLSKAINQYVSSSSSGYYQALCNSCSYKYGLYHPYELSDSSFNAKKFFHDELWIAKKKFATTTVSNNEDNDEIDSNDEVKSFKIRTVCRLRPGDRGNQSMNLPLHQFLKIKRSNSNNKSQSNGKGSVIVGANDPPEFVDPLLNILMRNPVLLTTSNRIVDKSVALDCILRGGRDPFNNKKLTSSCLIAQIELANKIREWKKSKGESMDVSVGLKEVKSLVNENMIDPELLEFLSEAENLANRAESLRRCADNTNKRRYKRGDGNNDDDDDDEHDDEHDVEENVVIETRMVDDVTNNENISSSDQNIRNSKKKSIDHQSNWKQVNEHARIVDVNESKACITMNVPGAGIKSFNFSNCHDGNATQHDIYVKNAKAMVASTMNGYNTTLLCYGQTGSGKTFTFFGPNSVMNMDNTSVTSTTDSDTHIALLPDDVGLVYRCVNELLYAKETLLKRSNISVDIQCSYIEIYDEQVIDLMNGNKVNIRSSDGQIVGCCDISINSMSDLYTTLSIGNQRKKFAETAMNERSSRSHTSFIINVSQHYLNHDTVVTSKMYLVDLAGSERINKSKVEGIRKHEAININKSLLVLGKVISSLVESKSHVPFLESKLTVLLKSAFGGNSRTTAIINCRSDDTNGDESLQSLRFGERCSMISNKSKLAASSLKSTIEMIEASLQKVSEQMLSLEKRNKTNQVGYKNLQDSYTVMLRKKNELCLKL